MPSAVFSGMMGCVGAFLTCDRSVASVYTLSKSSRVVIFSILPRLVNLAKTSGEWVVVRIGWTSDARDERDAMDGVPDLGCRGGSDSGLGASSNFSSILGVGGICEVGKAEPRRNADSTPSAEA